MWDFISALLVQWYTSPGCLGGRPHHPHQGWCRRGHPRWFLCSVRKINQVIALTSLPRGKCKLPFSESCEALWVCKIFLSFNSSTVYSSWLWTTQVPPFSDSSVIQGIRLWRWAYITILKHLQCCSHYHKASGSVIQRVLYLTLNSLGRKREK